MALVNIWHSRRVAEASAKPCDICYKPTTNVMITPDNKDHFYLCLGHLKDKGFCTPIVDEAAVAAKKKEEIDREVKLIKEEYDAKMKKKQEKKDKKDKKDTNEKDEKDEEKSKDDGKDGKSKDDVDEKKAEQEKDAKIKAVTNGDSTPSSDDIPRIYALQKVFYQKRLDRIRNAEIAKRNRERLKSPNLFPSVPTGNP